MSKQATPTPLPAAQAPTRSFIAANRHRVIADVGTEPSRTRQEFKDECDINRILSNYQRTGALNHFAKYSGSYGDFNACDLQEAQNLLIRARQLFDDLPSTIRKEVSTPEGFLTFVQDPKNHARMREFGLMKPETPAAPAATPPATPSQGA